MGTYRKHASRLLLAISVSLFGDFGLSRAGTIGLEWDPVPGALGYRVHYGDAGPGDYDHVIDVGNVTTYTIPGLQGCKRWYVAVKAYNGTTESAAFSNEIFGTTRPEILSITPGEITQGGQLPITIHGWTFKPGAELILIPESVPTDSAGEPLFRLENYSIAGCNRIEAFVTVEPLTRGVRAMPIGETQLQFAVINTDSIWGMDAVGVDIALEPSRIDINRSNSETDERADGQDLVWLTYAFGSNDGDARFNADADLDGDGTVDGADLALFASAFGTCWTGSTWNANACS